ncbi:MAG: efflux RND transporter periplasmic adaptor subunit [Candidatus Tyrphobacter sp.]
MKRAFVIVAVAAVGVVLVAWLVVRSHRGIVMPAVQQQVPVAIVRYGSVDETIELAGRVGPAAGTQTKLAFSIPGTVSGIDVSLGQHVQSGTILARLDARPLALAAQQAQAQAQAAAAQEAYARIDRISVRLRVDEAELARQRVLLGAGVVARRDVEAVQATVASDRADVQSAREALAAAEATAAAASARASSAQYDLSRSALRAPFDSVVVGVYAQPGQVVDATVPIVAVAAAQTYVATLDVPVTDVPRIASGDIVHVNAAGRTFDARIGAVAPAVNPATGLAELSVEGIPSDIPPGTPIDARVVYGHARGLVVPQSSLIADPQTGKLLTFVESHDRSGTQRFTIRNVSVGAQDARSAIVGGLYAGERVASQGTINLLAPPSGGD